MFTEEVHVTSLNDIPFGGTSTDVDKTLQEIKKLIRKMDPDSRIMVDEYQGRTRIAFTIDQKPFVICIPRVFSNGKEYPKIGPRAVLWYLKGVLTSVAYGASAEHQLLASRVVRMNTDGTHVPLADELEKVLKDIPLLGGGSR